MSNPAWNDRALATVTINYDRNNYDLADPVGWNTTDERLREIVEEAMNSGSVEGLVMGGHHRLTDYVVDRYEASEAIPFNRIVLRPEVKFG